MPHFHVTAWIAEERTNRLTMHNDTQTNLNIRCTDEFSVTPYSIFLLSCLRSEDFSGKTICDFGCGTGVIALNILHSHACEVIGLDIAPDAVKLARENTCKNNISGATFLTKEDLSGYVITHPDFSGFDYVISNPASLPTPPSVEINHFSNGGGFGDKMIIDLIEFSSEFLKPGGQLLFLHTSLAPFKQTMNRLDRAGFFVSVESILQLEFRDHYEKYESHFKNLRIDGMIDYFENAGRRYELIYFLRSRKPCGNNTGAPQIAGAL